MSIRNRLHPPAQTRPNGTPTSMDVPTEDKRFIIKYTNQIRMYDKYRTVNAALKN